MLDKNCKEYIKLDIHERYCVKLLNYLVFCGCEKTSDMSLKDAIDIAKIIFTEDQIKVATDHLRLNNLDE